MCGVTSLALVCMQQLMNSKLCNTCICEPSRSVANNMLAELPALALLYKAWLHVITGLGLPGA